MPPEKIIAEKFGILDYFSIYLHRQTKTHTTMSTYYQRKKEELRNEAIDWQADFSNHSYSWWDIADYQDDFERRARKFGLIREFRENGII